MTTLEIILSLITGFGGGAVLIFALSSWLGKVWANRILEKDRARYEKEMEDFRQRGAKQQFVHQLQFEKEFDIYYKLWGRLIKLGRAADRFRPGLHTSDGKSPEEHMKDFKTAYDGVDEIVYLYRPFYAPDVFECGKEILSNASSVYFNHGDPHEDKREHWKKARENMKNIGDIVEKICSAIRERIWPEKLVV